jgi:hypothetical protein
MGAYARISGVMRAIWKGYLDAGCEGRRGPLPDGLSVVTLRGRAGSER